MGEKFRSTRHTDFGRPTRSLDRVEPWRGQREPTGPRPVRELRQDRASGKVYTPRPDSTGQRANRGPKRPSAERPATRRRPDDRRRDTTGREAARPLRREPDGARKTRVYRRRRLAAISVVVFGVLALLFAAFTQASTVEQSPLPIDPNSASPATALATVSGINVSSPIRPVSINAIGYHPGGKDLLELAPRGENLSRGPLLGFLGTGSTPEKIGYYVMEPADRSGPKTGAVDVGADAGTQVYAPVTGVVTDVRPDPDVRDANVVEIRPEKNADVRVRVSLVGEITDNLSPGTPVAAGMTKIGRTAAAAGTLEPQLAAYTEGPGNHVTVSAVSASTAD